MKLNIAKEVVKETGLLSFLFDFGFKFNVNFTHGREHIFLKNPEPLEISSFHHKLTDLLSFPSAGQSQTKPRVQNPCSIKYME